jgi:hypothetical protein
MGHHPASLPDLRIQIAMMQFRALASGTLRTEKPFEVVIDHDSKRISVGGRGRQTTLRVGEVLQREATEASLNRVSLDWDGQRRFSSKFPRDFTYETFWQQGYPLRPLVECIGLQFVDVCLGLWKQLTLHGKSPARITASELGSMNICKMTWAWEEGPSE